MEKYTNEQIDRFNEKIRELAKENIKAATNTLFEEGLESTYYHFAEDTIYACIMYLKSFREK